MSKKPRFPPKTRLIEIVLFPGFQLLDAAGPIAAFEIAAQFAPRAYRLRLAAGAPGLIASSSGAAMPAEALSTRTQPDTLIVVGGAGTAAAMADKRLIAALKRASGRVRRLASVCSGAF